MIRALSAPSPDLKELKGNSTLEDPVLFDIRISFLVKDQYISTHDTESKSFYFPGPQENPDDCGTPILCMFYGLILFIIMLTIYTTIKGTTE